jgi:hypothetical protein
MIRPIFILLISGSVFFVACENPFLRRKRHIDSANAAMDRAFLILDSLEKRTSSFSDSFKFEKLEPHEVPPMPAK